MFMHELIASITAYRAMQGTDDLQRRRVMNMASSRNHLVQAGVELNIIGEPGFTIPALSGQTDQSILRRLGIYLIRDEVEAGMLAYVALDKDALALLAEAAILPEAWLRAAYRRIDRYNGAPRLPSSFAGPSKIPHPEVIVAS
jgi:hypothetical protein